MSVPPGTLGLLGPGWELSPAHQAFPQWTSLSRRIQKPRASSRSNPEVPSSRPLIDHPGLRPAPGRVRKQGPASVAALDLPFFPGPQEPQPPRPPGRALPAPRSASKSYSPGRGGTGRGPGAPTPP